MSDTPAIVKSVTKPKPTDEIGAPGLKTSGGYMQEEFVYELRGQRGAQRYREMVDNCPAADAALTTMKNTALRAIQDGRIEPFGNKAEDKERAEFVEQCFEDMAHSRADMDLEALTMFEYGFAPLEIVYKRRAGYKTDEDRSSRYDDEAIGWSKVTLRAQESLLRWDFDEFGRKVLGMVQTPAPTYREFTIPIDRLALFRTTPVKGNPEGRSLLRAAYFAWKFFKRGTTLAWVGAERDLVGIPVLKGPQSIFPKSAGEAASPQYAALKKMGEDARNDEQACVLLSSEVDDKGNPLYSFELVSSPGSKIMDVPAMTKDQERQILMVLFSDFLLMGHEKIGTQAMFGGRMGLYAMQLDALLDRYDEVINRQMIPRLALLNGWPMDRLPTYKHGAVTESNLEELGKFLQSYATAGGILDPELDNYLREQAGWPQAAPEALDMLLAPPPPQLVPGADPNNPNNPNPDPNAKPEPDAGTHETDREAEAPEVEDEEGGEDKKPEVKKWDPDQPRDELGRWGEGGGGGSSSGGGGSSGSGSSGGGSWSDADSGAAGEQELAGEATRSQYESVRVGLVGTSGNPTSLSQKERSTLQSYSHTGHEKMNAALRAGRTSSDAKAMDSLFSKARPLGESITVYRGMGAGATSKLSSLGIGDVFQDRAFVSTSFSIREAGQFSLKNGGGLMRILVPKGSSVLPGVALEREVILKRGVKFKVVSKDKDGVTVEATW